MNRLTARERRLAAIGLLVLVLAIAWLGVLSPILSGFSARAEERAGLLAAYQRNQRLLDAIPSWRMQAEAQKKSAAAFALYAPSQVQARETLKQCLASALTAQGATPTAVQDAEAELPQGWIGARADVQISLSQLLASLRQLESEPPYVVIEYVSINADQAFHTGHDGPLQVRLEISAPFRVSAVGQP
jgi:general secretion pathway protein M